MYIAARFLCLALIVGSIEWIFLTLEAPALIPAFDILQALTDAQSLPSDAFDTILTATGIGLAVGAGMFGLYQLAVRFIIDRLIPNRRINRRHIVGTFVFIGFCYGVAHFITAPLTFSSLYVGAVLFWLTGLTLLDAIILQITRLRTITVTVH